MFPRKLSGPTATVILMGYTVVHFPGFGVVSQENRTTPTSKGPVCSTYLFKSAIGPAPHRVSRALRAREPRKSPKRVPKEYPGTGPQKSRKSAPRSPKRVRKESKTRWLLDSFRTLLGLRGALFRDFWGPVPGYSFGTLFGLFRGSRARRARETLCGAGPIALIQWATFRLQKSRSRGKDEKIRQKRQRWERRQNIETWKTPTLGVVFFGPVFTIKLGKIEIWPFLARWLRLWLYIYIYI